MVVDGRRDPRVAAVSADQPLGCVERDDGRDDLSGVMGAHDQHGRLVLVHRHVVGDLQGEEVPAFKGGRGAVGGRDIDDLRDRRIGRRDLVHPVDDAVEVPVGRRDGDDRRPFLKGLLEGTALREDDHVEPAALQLVQLGARDHQLHRGVRRLRSQHVVSAALELCPERRRIRGLDPDTKQGPVAVTSPRSCHHRESGDGR